MTPSVEIAATSCSTNAAEATAAAKHSGADKSTVNTIASIEAFSLQGQTEVMTATKCANAFPKGAARDLYCACPTFGKVIDAKCDQILGLISKVLKSQKVKGNIQRRQQDEQYEMLLECNDVMLERIGSNLDELAGIKKRPEPVLVEARLDNIQQVSRDAGSWNQQKTTGSASVNSARLLTMKNLPRPQINFKTPVDNKHNTPFTPKIKEKPNSLKPLALIAEYDDDGNIENYLHPYEFELLKFEVPAAQLLPKIPQKPAAVTDTPLLYVDTVEKLKQALEELRSCQEIAVDVEHHSYRSFLGFTCLVQMSSRQKDYIFDAIALREEMHVLNEVLTNPRILKILHGAEQDVQWLQRDLSLYIVNMFDTHQASKFLKFAALSLAFLLRRYCGIEADKTLQLADWRMRPLPQELVNYARQDTHFLIFIYENLHNELLEMANQQTNMLQSVYQLSTEVCKIRYFKPQSDKNTAMELYRKSKRIFDNRQLFAFVELCNWRDVMARMEDESYHYVLPNHMMLQIAENLPREMQGILACCNPIPPMVRQHLHAMHQIMLRAREQPLVKPIWQADVMHRVAMTNVLDYNSKLYCPHDLSHSEEFRDDLPTLINFKDQKTKNDQVLQDNYAVNTNVTCTNNISNIVPVHTPRLSYFACYEKNVLRSQAMRDMLNEQYVKPYMRYLAVLPEAAKEKLEEAARIDAELKKRRLCPAEPTAAIKVELKKQSKQDEMYGSSIKATLKRKQQEAIDLKAAKRLKTKLAAVEEGKINFSNLPVKEKPQKVSSTTSMFEIETSKTPASNSNDEAPIELPSTSRAIKQHQRQQQQRQRPHLQQQPNFKSKNKQQKKFKYVAPKTQQSSSQGVQRPNFDYQQVDFKKFQGGAKRAAGVEIRPQLHGKSNSSKAHNKKFNKLFTFTNVNKGNKK